MFSFQEVLRFELGSSSEIYFLGQDLAVSLAFSFSGIYSPLHRVFACLPASQAHLQTARCLIHQTYPTEVHPHVYLCFSPVY